jgi:hypothetical protein
LMLFFGKSRLMVLVLLPRLELSVTLFSRIVAAPMAAAYTPGLSRGAEYGHFIVRN